VTPRHIARRSDNRPHRRSGITEHTPTEVQPGDGFLAEVAAGLGLPTHQDSAQHEEETAMVGPTLTPTHPTGGAS
jgi:hypothetical protein